MLGPLAPADTDKQLFMLDVLLDTELAHIECSHATGDGQLDELVSVVEPFSHDVTSFTVAGIPDDVDEFGSACNDVMLSDLDGMVFGVTCVTLTRLTIETGEGVDMDDGEEVFIDEHVVAGESRVEKHVVLGDSRVEV